VTEPIFDHLREEAEHATGHVLHRVEAVFGHGRYHAGSVTENPPEESAMAEGFDDDLKEYFSEGFTYVKNLATRMEAEAPRLISLATAAGSQTVSAAVEALAGRVLPPDIDAWLAGFIKDAIAKFGAPAQSAQPAAEQPAEAPAA
jgi:hypothetical protein